MEWAQFFDHVLLFVGMVFWAGVGVFLLREFLHWMLKTKERRNGCAHC